MAGSAIVASPVDIGQRGHELVIHLDKLFDEILCQIIGELQERNQIRGILTDTDVLHDGFGKIRLEPGGDGFLEVQLDSLEQSSCLLHTCCLSGNIRVIRERLVDFVVI